MRLFVLYMSVSCEDERAYAIETKRYHLFRCKDGCVDFGSSRSRDLRTRLDSLHRVCSREVPGYQRSSNLPARPSSVRSTCFLSGNIFQRAPYCSHDDRFRDEQNKFYTTYAIYTNFPLAVVCIMHSIRTLYAFKTCTTKETK